MSEHNGRPTPTFDASEPRTKFIGLLGLGIMVGLVVIILALQSYVDRVEQQQIYEKVLAPVSEDLKTLRAREDAELTQYKYLDRGKGTVRLPIARAMELMVEEKHAK
jgi:hypothetical protein